LYELIFDLALAALLVWLGHHTKVRPPGLFALYVTGYSAFRIFEESLRIDYSVHFLGLRLNTFVATALTIIGVIWFVLSQRRPPVAATSRAETSAEGGTAADEVAGAPDRSREASEAGASAGDEGAAGEAQRGAGEGDAGIIPDTSGRRT